MILLAVEGVMIYKSAWGSVALIFPFQIMR